MILKDMGINFILFCVACFILSLALIVIVMPYFIKALKRRNINQVTSEYALDEFKNKEKTPIMGGLLFVVLPIIAYVVLNAKGFADKKTLFVVLSFVLYCLVGFADDMLIINSGKNDGLSPISRLIMELGISIVLYFVFSDIIPCQITIPFTSISIKLPVFIFVPFMSLLYMAEANAVNFTDGMDGLCAGVSFIGLIPFVVLSILHGNSNIALLIFCIMGGLLGYLFFNHHPAKIFMGDSGSLALGALFASLAIVDDLTIALFVIGGVFVAEMFCVVVQQVSVRLFHKRVFSYTPIHYAFVLKGYKETKIVYGFYLVAIVLAILGLIIGLNTL